MGIELTDICMDKEPDCVILYSNGASNDSDHETFPNLNDSKSYEHVNGDPVFQVMEENMEVKEYVVKECTTENSIDISELRHIEKSKEEQTNVSAAKSEVDLPREKVIPENGKPKDHNKLHSSAKRASKFISGNVRTKHTVPQPFVLATEKRASSGYRPAVPEPDAATGVSKSPNGNCVHHPNTKNLNQLSLVPRKPLQPTNKKHPDEEDSCSVTSSTGAATGRTVKSRTTVASAPTFRSTVRAEKRRQFYSKLEEKNQALEAEKTQSEARTKEEREAAIKQLRRSLMFKANPMPSFYHEGPPPKVELKKLPPTRAKSPKLGRRKSSGDVVSSTERDMVRGAYSQGICPPSLGSSKEENTSTGFTNVKDQSSVQNDLAICKFKDEPARHVEEKSELSLQKAIGHSNIEIGVQS